MTLPLTDQSSASRRGPRWARRLRCRLTDHRVSDVHLANGCLHACARCGWIAGVLPPSGESFRPLRPRTAAATQLLAVDYLLAVLSADTAGRDAARARLLEDPASTVACLGMLTLGLSEGDGTRARLQHMAAMGELRTAVGLEP